MLSQCSLLVGRLSEGVSRQICMHHSKSQMSLIGTWRLSSHVMSTTAHDHATQINRLNTDADSPAVDATPTLTDPDYFGVRSLCTVRDLFDAGVHLGHKTGVRNQFTVPYIFGNRLGMDIIDLEQTHQLLGDALNFTAHVAHRGGIILFLSRHQQMMLDVEKTAQESGEYSHCRQWRNGTFTNATTKFQAQTRLPDLCIFLTTHDSVFEQHEAVTEAAKMNIPAVGILDTSCDPRLITYPVPGNDDSPSAISLYLRLFKEAIMKGKGAKKQTDTEKTDGG